MDTDLDSLFLQQFSSMATQDRDVLIAQFKSLLGNEPHLNDDLCSFYLDMSNWNLQGAICYYFEFPSHSFNNFPRMKVEDVENNQIPLIVSPGSTFIKSFHVSNAGTEPWPQGCCLRQISGPQLLSSDRYMVEKLAPGCTTQILLECCSPSLSGTYVTSWRMSTATGSSFGEILSFGFQVPDDTMATCTGSAPSSSSHFCSDMIPHAHSDEIPPSVPCSSSQPSSPGHPADTMDMS